MGSTNGNELRLRRSRWVYEGLSVPAGVAVVRRSGPEAPPGLPGQLLVVGDETAQAVGPPLVRLCRDAQVAILVQGRPGQSPRAWLEQGWLQDAVGRCVPDLVLFAFNAAQSPEEIDALAVLSPAPSLALSIDEEATLATKTATAVQLPACPDTMMPTAASYAAWAGEVWQTMSNGLRAS